MGILVTGMGVIEFLLILAYPKPTPFMIFNILFGLAGIIGGIFMLNSEARR